MYFGKGKRMKKVLISINPKWCEKIVSGEKTIEVRKSSPGEVPFKCYIYCTKEKGRNAMYRGNVINGKVIGEFICDKVYDITPHNDGQGTNQYICGWAFDIHNHCLTFEQLDNYLKGKKGYGWHISDLKIYDKPRELSEFISPSKYKNCVDYCRNGICSNLDYEELCGAIKHCRYKKISRPPESWCYVEEL